MSRRLIVPTLALQPGSEVAQDQRQFRMVGRETAQLHREFVPTRRPCSPADLHRMLQQPRASSYRC